MSVARPVGAGRPVERGRPAGGVVKVVKRFCFTTAAGHTQHGFEVKKGVVVHFFPISLFVVSYVTIVEVLRHGKWLSLLGLLSYVTRSRSRRP